MSSLRETTTRLSEIAEELRDENMTDERAEALAREAAELVGQASNDIDRALRESSSDEA